MSTRTSVCPQCGKNDLMQRVSALYSSGMSVTQYETPVSVTTKHGTFYGSQKHSATTISSLARRLAPPLQPKRPNESEYPYLKYASSSFKNKRLLIGFSMIFILFGVTGACIVTTNSVIIGSIVFSLGIFVISWLATALGQLIPPLGKLMLDTMGAGNIKTIEQAKATGSAEIFRLQAIAKEKFNEAVRHYEMWPIAQKKWETLYYCARCDGVFAESTFLVPVEHMHTFLYDITPNGGSADKRGERLG